jgi:hypothetical protein
MKRLLSISLFLYTGLLSAQDYTWNDQGAKGSFTPSFTMQNPLNPGNLGTIVLGGVLQDRTRLGNKVDANAELYLGLGKPEKLLGAGVTLNIHGLANKIGEQDNLGKGTASFHLSRFLFNKKLLLDAGIDNAFLWGGDIRYDEYITYKKSMYVVGNYLFYLKAEDEVSPFQYLSVTLGAGNGYYGRDEKYNQNENGAFNPLLSIATPVFHNTNLLAEWNGYDFGVGLSSIPFQKLPFVFRLEGTDFIFGMPRYIFSVSLPFYFGSKNEGEHQRPVGVKSIRPARTL